MNQRIALLTAGALTATVVISVLAFSLFASPAPSQASMLPQPDGSDVSATETNTTIVDEAFLQEQQAFEAVAAEREQLLKQQVADRQAALTELDKTLQLEIEKLQMQLTVLEVEIASKSESIQTLQAGVQAEQQAMEQENLLYQNDLTALQNTMVQTDAALRQQLEASLGQLQTAYDEIAARQAASSSQNNSSNSDNDYEDHDDDHDDDDDDHEEHEHEHDDDDD